LPDGREGCSEVHRELPHYFFPTMEVVCLDSGGLEETVVVRKKRRLDDCIYLEGRAIRKRHVAVMPMLNVLVAERAVGAKTEFVKVGELVGDNNERHVIWRENCKCGHIEQVFKELLKRRSISNAELSQHLSIIHDAAEHLSNTLTGAVKKTTKSSNVVALSKFIIILTFLCMWPFIRHSKMNVNLPCGHSPGHSRLLVQVNDGNSPGHSKTNVRVLCGHSPGNSKMNVWVLYGHSLGHSEMNVRVLCGHSPGHSLLNVRCYAVIHRD